MFIYFAKLSIITDVINGVFIKKYGHSYLFKIDWIY